MDLDVRKVGFLGSAPSSFSMAPVADPAWEIWACGPGRHLEADFEKHFHRWFELHDMAENDPQYGAVIDGGYFEWLQKIGKTKTVYYRPPLYPGLEGVVIPWDEIASRHSHYFLDSTISWMMALVYDYCDVDEIGIWGIDFATDEERRKQRKGAKHFIELFRLKGVPCKIPDVSDMSFNPPPYPEQSHLFKKAASHINILTRDRNSTASNIANLKETLIEQEKHLARIDGTLQTLEHFKENWA